MGLVLHRLVPLVLVAAVAGCSGSPEPSATTSSSPSGTSSSVPSSESPETPAAGEAAAELGLRPGWGPTAEELDEATRAVRRLSLPELAGQVIVATYAGTEAPVDLVTSLHLGGVIAFTDNIASTDQVRQVNRQLTEATDRDWPLFLSVDQEGGIVERVKGDATRFPTFMSAGAARDPELTRRAYAASGAELRGLGFTVDFAPDGDVTSGPDDPTIGSRSAGSDPGLVAEQMTAAAAGYLEGGVVPVIKHFPGHGSVPADSHLTLPVQTKTRAELLASDLVPFERGIADGISAVMVGHLDVRAIDPGVPSSVSKKVVTGLLRDRLGFDGLVVTDSLQMQGVAGSRTSAESAVQALLAGGDVVLMPPDPAAARDGIVAAVDSGRLPLKRLQQAAARQIALLVHDAAGEGAALGSAARASADLSAAAVTVVDGPCRGRLVERSVRPVGDAEAVATFTAAAREAGLAVGSGDTVAFIGYGGAPVTADVAVATDTPYALGSSDAPVRIASYGETPGAMAALVQVLLGNAPAPGRLPVDVPGVPRRGC